MWKSLVIAFSMYSKIPMPHVAWTEKSMRFAMCYFPCIGIVIGGAEVLLWWLCRLLGLHTVLTAAFCCAVPVLITGGIHLDGFCDTVDARSSHQPREKKLEILKDPHIGAFGVLYLCLYFLVQFGLYCQISSLRQMLAVGCGFVLSRALSAGALLCFRNAKAAGTAHYFAFTAQRRAVLCSSGVWMILGLLFLGVLGIGALALAAAGLALALGYYRWMSYRQFGGITGDLAGWFLQVCELVLLGSVVLSGILQWI